MSYATRVTVVVTTDTNGDATELTQIQTGMLSQIRYVKTDFAGGVDFTITNDTTGEQLWVEQNVDASVTVAPRQATHSVLGVASLYDTVSNEPVEDTIALANDQISIVVANGGDTKTGTFHVMIA